MRLEGGFRLGDHVVRPGEGRIIGPSGATRVEPKSMAVLVELARHAPAARSREDIVATVWPRGYVTDDALTRCIGLLRKALGDDPRSPGLIETIPRRGYRLTVAATALEPSSGAAAVAPGETNPPEALLVLPFQNLGPSAEEYVADGLTELLISRLATARNLRVISRTTSMSFKGVSSPVPEIAHRTGSRWIIEGSVLQSGDQLQVVVQLIDGAADAHVWTEDYVRSVEDLLQLQNEIARKVASVVRLKLGIPQAEQRRSATLPPDAMRSYLLGRHLLARRSPDALREAVGAFSNVCADAPDFAGGWASRAEANFMLAHYGALPSREAAEACHADLSRALTLDPDLGLGLACRGATRFGFDRDLTGARADLERALEAMPSYSLGMLALANVCAVAGDFDAADRWLDQALLVDPLDVGINMNVGDHRILQRRYDEAAAALRRTLGIAPGHRPSRLRLAWTLALAGQAEESRAELAAAGPQDRADWQWQEYAALVHGVLGDTRAAREALALMQCAARAQPVAPWSLARAAAAAGDLETAFAYLAEAVAARSTSVPFLGLTPAFDSLRGDPRLRVLLTR